jgi:cardiolipin synthase
VKHIRRALLVIGVAALVVAIALAIAQDQVTIKIGSAYAAADPDHPSYLAALINAPLTRGNTYDVLTNGVEIYPAMLDAIEGARRRINFETYVYATGEIPNRFTDAFERAARRGVQVTVIVDAVGAASMDDQDAERLRSAGATVLRFHPTHWYSIEELNYRTHRKILVVDGEIGFTGGAGVADYWKGNAEGEDSWRDTHVRMRGPIVRLLEAAFYEVLVESYGPATPVIDPNPPVTHDEGASFIVRSSTTSGGSDMKRVYLLAIAAARRTLDIATPYFVPDESTLWSLEDAVRRGVRVRILVESEITDAMPVKYASRAFYDRLLTMGLEIYEYQPTMMHAKVLVVDGVLSMFGSANFDNRSLELNDELNVVVSSPELASRFLRDFENDLRASRRLELNTWRERSLLAKSREQFWSYFGEVF